MARWEPVIGLEIHAELMTRTYHESQDKPTYLIKAILNESKAAEPAVIRRLSKFEPQSLRRP